MTDVAALVITAAAGLVGAAIPITANFFDERARSRETWLFRNHEKRSDAAVQYLEQLAKYRRAVRVLGYSQFDMYARDKAEVDDAARRTADFAAQLRLWFDSVVERKQTEVDELMRKMQDHAEVNEPAKSEDFQERRTDKYYREHLLDLDEKTRSARDALIEAMKPQLGESANGRLPSVYSRRFGRA